MNSERWQEIESVFAAALERTGDDRERFLDDRCSGDPELQREIATLLASADSAGDYFSGLAGRIGVPADHTAPSERLVGKRIGNYRLVRLIGRGGMGAVYLVERDDAQFQMQGALKLLPLGLDSDEAHRRFLAERQILARLSHPSIARLLDGGVTDDGTPYFVMEYVEGKSITSYCNAHQLSIPQRLGLFHRVCEAVQHAHQNLIVHRDLKPGNILVTDSGDVKLLDFGIARVMEDESAGAQTAVTRRAQPMTLAYASPEQIRGEPATTASDVYALGVLLYRLLTGHHPYQLSVTSVTDVARVICETNPAPPSAVVGRPGAAGEVQADRDGIRLHGMKPQRLRRYLKGDIDTVVLTALRKEPERRYASVSHLADDLRRCVAGQPVTAHRDTLGYRTSRFVRRHKVGVVTAAVIGLLMAALVVVSLRFAVTTSVQSREIARAAETANQVSTFLIDLFEVSDPDQGIGDTVTARSILDRGAATIETGLAGQPEVQAHMMYVLGQVYGNLGLTDQSLRFHESALELRRELHGSDHLGVAESAAALGHVRRSARHWQQAAEAFREALDIRVRLRDDPPSIADALQGLATSMRDLNQLDSAELLMNQALDIRTRYRSWDHPEMAPSRVNLAYILTRKGDLDSAIVLYRQTIHQLREVGDSTSQTLRNALNNLGYVYRVKEDYVRAERTYREALEAERRSGVPATQLTVMVNLASAVELQGGRNDEVYDILNDRIALAREHWPADHWQIGSALAVLGAALVKFGDSAQAEPLRRASVEIYRKALGDAHSWTAHAKVGLGSVLTSQRRFAEAEPLVLDGYRVLHESDETGEWTRNARAELVRLYRAWGKPDRAEEYEPRVRGVPKG